MKDKIFLPLKECVPLSKKIRPYTEQRHSYQGRQKLIDSAPKWRGKTFHFFRSTSSIRRLLPNGWYRLPVSRWMPPAGVTLIVARCQLGVERVTNLSSRGRNQKI